MRTLAGRADRPSLKPVRDLQYTRLAKYYDLVRTPDGYGREAGILRRVIPRYKTSGGNELLDAGCGTGGHLRYLVSDFDCTGLDLYEEMLRVARKNLPAATFVQSDMSDFRLRKSFDVIICMYSAIGLVRTYQNLARTVRCFSNHLKSGGIVIIENDSFSFPKSRSPHIGLQTFEKGDTKIAKVEYYRRKGALLIEREEYLVGERGKGVGHYVDVQYSGMFELKKTMQILRRMGLKPIYLEGALHRGRGLLVGVKA